MTVTADGVVAGGSAARVSGRGPARAAAVEQLSRADRVARGKDARAAAPLESHAEFTPAGKRDPVGLLRGAGKDAGAGAGAGAARADAGVGVHVLPGRGAADGGRPGHHSHVGAAGAAVRGCPPVEFRRVRLAGAQPGLRRQRLRRDPAGAVRVGRQAAGREPDGGRTGQRVPRQGLPQDHSGGGRRLPHRDARVRGPDLHGRLVHARGHRAGPGPVPVPGQGEKVQGSPEAAGQGAHQRHHEGRGQADHRGRRAAADHQPAPADRPGRGGLPRRAGRRDLPAAEHRAGQVPAHPAVRPAAPARAVHHGTGGPQGGRGRQRRHPRLCPADGRPGRRRAVVPAGQGGPAVGPGGVRRAQPVHQPGSSAPWPGST